METIKIGNLELAVAPDVAQSSDSGLAFPVSKPQRKAKPRRSIPQSKLILALAKKHRFENVRRIGCGSLPDQPVQSNGWLVMPKEMYKGIIPPDVLKQAETLTRGIPIKGFLVADDQRHLERKRQKEAPVNSASFTDWGKVADTAGKVAAVVAVGAAALTVIPIVLGLAAVGAALAYDPLLIAVTAEDEWIVVGEWWD